MKDISYKLQHQPKIASNQCNWDLVQAYLGPSPRNHYAVCMFKNYLYLYGGRGKLKPLNDFWKYDIENSSWAPVQITDQKVKPPALEGHTIVENDGKLYMFGGEISLASYGKIPLWVFDQETLIWEKISAGGKPTGRREHICVVYNNKMYVHGGYIDIKGATKEMWTYNFRENVWELCAAATNGKCPEARYKHSGVVLRDKLFISGGLISVSESNNTRMWSWDFLEEKWTSIRITCAPPQLFGHATCIVGNEMFVFGGYNRQGKINKKLCKVSLGKYYWKDTQTWKSCRFKNVTTVNPDYCCLVGLSHKIVHRPEVASRPGVTKKQKDNVWKPFLSNHSLSTIHSSGEWNDQVKIETNPHVQLKKAVSLEVLPAKVDLNVDSTQCCLRSQHSVKRIKTQKQFSQSLESLIVNNPKNIGSDCEVESFEENLQMPLIRKTKLVADQSIIPKLTPDVSTNSSVGNKSMFDFSNIPACSYLLSIDDYNHQNKVETDELEALLPRVETEKEPLGNDSVSPCDDNVGGDMSSADSNQELLPILHNFNQETLKKKKKIQYEYGQSKNQLEHNARLIKKIFFVKTRKPFKPLHNQSASNTPCDAVKPSIVTKPNKINRLSDKSSDSSNSNMNGDLESIHKSLAANSIVLDKLKERMDHVDINDAAINSLIHQVSLLVIGSSFNTKQALSYKPARPCIRVWKCSCT